jgi:glycosyltransferase
MTTTISIITVTFNSASTIRDCLDSVRSQHVATEHLIIDGGSTDGTLDIAKSFPHVSKIVSEPDRGIYDAMNKGIALATGAVVGILNSDDFYAGKNVLEKVVGVFNDESIDSCYGDLVYVDPTDINKITRCWKAGTFTQRCFYWGWMPPHPTFFVRRSVYKKYGLFKLNLGSAADYELMLRLLVKHGISTTYMSDVLVKMRAGGVSNITLKNRLKANRMDRYAWTVNDLNPYPWTTYLKPLSKIKQYFV